MNNIIGIFVCHYVVSFSTLLCSVVFPFLVILLFISIRRQGGIKLDDADDNNTEDENEGSKQDLEEEEMLLKQQKEIAAKKEKEENLWAAFKRDTGMMASNSSKTTLSQMVRSKC